MLAVSVWEFMFVELSRYSASEPVPYQLIFQSVIAVEGLIWLTLSVMAVRRNRQHRRSSLELFYGALFFMAAMAAVREMLVVQPALIVFKLVVLLGILWVRQVLRKKYYPGSRW